MSDPKPDHKKNSQKTKFYDVSFDAPVEESYENELNQKETPIKESKWDNFYEKYAQEQSHKYSTQYIKKDFQGDIDQNEPIVSKDPVAKESLNDDWSFKPQNSQTITGASSQFFSKYYSKTKDFFQGLGNHSLDKNPYKEAADFAYQDSKLIDDEILDQAVTDVSNTARQLKQKRKSLTHTDDGVPTDVPPKVTFERAKKLNLDSQSKETSKQNQLNQPSSSGSEQISHSIEKLVPSEKNRTNQVDAKTSAQSLDKLDPSVSLTSKQLEPHSIHTGLNTQPTTDSNKTLKRIHKDTSLPTDKAITDTKAANYVASSHTHEEQLAKSKEQTSPAPAELTKETKKQASQLDKLASKSDLIHANHVKNPIRQSELKATDTQVVNSPLSLSDQASAQKMPTYRHNSDLPSPDQIAQERERRRKLRIEQLEQLSSLEEVEKSHFQYTSDPYFKSKQELNTSHTVSSVPLKSDTHSNLADSTYPKSSQPTSSLTEDKQKHQQAELISKEINDDTKDSGVANKLKHQAIHSTATNKHAIDSEPKHKQPVLSSDVEEQVPLPLTPINEKQVAGSISKADISESNLLKQTSDDLSKQDIVITEGKKITNKQAEQVDQLENHPQQTQTAMIDQKSHHLDEKNSLSHDQKSNEERFIESSSHTEIPLSIDLATNEPEIDNEDALLLTDKTVTSLDDVREADPFDEDATHISKQSRQRKHQKHEKKAYYDLSTFNHHERIIFALNVFINVIKRFVFFAIILCTCGAALAGGAGLGYFANLVAKTEPPSQAEMATKINQLEQLSTIYYADGSQIANVRADVVRSKTNLNDISQFIIDGLISVEDEYFYEHHGVMPKAILRAIIQEIIQPGTGTGGSTLTQQLVKQRLLSNDVTFFRKANEILLALRLENYFSKDEILTAYLNVSPFGRNNNGENVAGIAKASEGLFGKSPAEVNLAQAAFLVGLPQNPYTYTPYDQNGHLREDLSAGIERMKTVLYRMYRNQKISQAEYDEAVQYDITKDFLPTEQKYEERQTYLYQAMMNGAIEQIMALRIKEDGFNWDQVYHDDDWYNEYYFAAQQELQTGGYKIFTTIDKQIYDQMNSSAQAHIDTLGPKYEGIYTDPNTGQETPYLESAQAGVVLIDNTSGKVLGFVSGTDYQTNQIDHAFRVRRSPGSTIKPLAAYGPALEMNLITPATQIANTAFAKTYEDGTEWTPTNYGGVVPGGSESARIALLKSDNIPAVRIYEALQKKQVNVHNYLVKMGFNDASYPQEDVQNLAFSIGGVTTGPTVFEQTRAFSTIANNGQYVDGYYIAKIEDANGQIIFEHKNQPVQVFSEDSNYLLVDMLRDVMTEGTATTARSLLTMGGDWIAKTGTSENLKDVWLIAATPKITIGSWIGYDNRFATYTIDRNDGFGPESERSQRFTTQILNDLYAIRPDIFGIEQQFVQPSTVVATSVLQQTGTLPGNVTTPYGPFYLGSPTYQELFKTSSSAPQLVYDFILGASEEDLAQFWNTVYTYYLNQQKSSDSDESSKKENENEDENGDESTTTTIPAETTSSQ